MDTFDFGLWTPYINEPFTGWYWVHESLQLEWDDFTPASSNLEALPAERWTAVHQAAIEYAEKSVAWLNNPYHNAKHFRVTEENGAAAIEALERMTGVVYPTAVKQAFRLALRLHDCHHCGSAFRVDAPHPELLYRLEFGSDVSQEWVSGIAADEFGRGQGLDFLWRLFMVMVIYASTYGGNTAKGAEIDVPIVEPVGVWGCVMRAADVCPSADVTESMLRSVAVMYGEAPAAPVEPTWRAFVSAQTGFLKYVEHCFDQLDAVTGVALTQQLGWRDNLAAMVQGVQSLNSDRMSNLARSVQAEAGRYGIVLR